MPSWEYQLIGFMDAFTRIEESERVTARGLTLAGEEWWRMVAEAGADGWEAVTFGVDQHGNYVFMKRERAQQALL